MNCLNKKVTMEVIFVVTSIKVHVNGHIFLFRSSGTYKKREERYMAGHSACGRVHLLFVFLYVFEFQDLNLQEYKRVSFFTLLWVSMSLVVGLTINPMQQVLSTIKW